MSIEGLKKSVDFAFEEMKTLKDNMSVVKLTSSSNVKRIADLKQKLNDAERYNRRWCLRIHGMEEKHNEDVKARVADICCAVIDDEARNTRTRDDIDIVHRLGRYSDKQTRPRTTIVRFTTRTTRDLVWKKAKDNSFLSENRLRFAEDLTTADKKVREELWPLIEAARKEGKIAHFAGTRVIIDGKEVRDPKPPPKAAQPMDTALPVSIGKAQQVKRNSKLSSGVSQGAHWK